MQIKCACGCEKMFTPSRANAWRIRTGKAKGFMAGHALRGANNGRWNNGETMSAQGYRLVKAPDGHPTARSSGYILEHRLVMERKIGRPLLDEEIVHHINEDKLDNRPENLEITDRAEHGHHHKPEPWTELKICPTCGKTFRKKWNQSRDQFCSRKCISGTAPKGAAHHASKLTSEIVREIRQRANVGESQGSIAKSFDVGRETIGKVLRGEAWKHVL